MEPPSPTTPVAPTGQRLASAVQDRQGRPEGSTVEPPPTTPAQAGLQGGPDPLAKRDRDMIGARPPERRDTNDSWAFEFRQQRTNTGWSVASVSTDTTEPSSPVGASFQDEPLDLYAESYSSSPRHSTLPSRSVTFQDCPPSLSSAAFVPEGDKPRAPRYGASPENPSPPRHRRVDEVAARRGSVGRPAGHGLPFRRRPSQPSTSQTGPPARTVGGLSTAIAGGGSHEPGGGARSTADVLDPATAEDDGSPREQAGNPGQESSVPGLPDSACSEASVSDLLPREEEASSSYRPDDSMVQDFCEKILQHAFGLELDELVLPGAASAAYESVSYCLDELSHIVSSGRPSDAGFSICESARGITGFGAAPIWPAAGGAHYHGGGSESGGGGNGSESGGGPQKRANGDSGGDGAGDGGAGDGGGKRLKLSSNVHVGLQAQGLHLSCPFRKRNPVKFNVRDFQSCAVQSFPDIPQLKRHVKNFHKQKIASVFACPRCKQDMRTKEAFDDHLAVDKDQICSFRRGPISADPEDGITSRTEDVLNGRKADSKIDSWEGLWRTLFPLDQEIPEPDFVPPTELDEVYEEFKTDSCLSQLRHRIQEELSEHDSIERMMVIVQGHVDFVFDTCRSRTGGLAGRPRRNRVQGLRQTTTSPQSSKRPIPRHPDLQYQGPEFRETDRGSKLSTSADLGAGINSLDSPRQPVPVMIPQPHMRFVPQTAGYTDAGADNMMAVFAASGRGGIPSKNAHPVTVTVPRQVHYHGGFPGQAQLVPRLQPADSGVDLHGAFAAQRGLAAVYPGVRNVLHGEGMFNNNPQNGYENAGFGQCVPGPCFRTTPRPQAMQGQASPARERATDPNPDMDPSVDFLQEELMDNAEFDGFSPRQ